MKLLTHTTLYYVVASCMVFLLGGSVMLWLVHRWIAQDTEDRFTRQEIRLMEGITKGDIDPARMPRYGRFVLRPLSKPPLSSLAPIYRDTLIRIDRWEMRFRQKTYPKQIKDNWYMLTLRTSMEDAQQEVEVVIYTLLGLGAGLLLAVVLVHYFLTRQLLRPFTQTLHEIRKFDLNRNTPLQLPNTNISEFEELNIHIREMTDKMRADYQALKEFTENASHEMQTPLAVIQSQLENMLTNETLSEAQRNAVEQSYAATRRLARLNQALTLLTRIENHEFSNVQEVNLVEVFERTWEMLVDFAEQKRITLHTRIEPFVGVCLDPALAEILMSNLLKNAIKHNYTGGSIEVILQASYLCISNTGKPPTLPTERLFDRFKKGNGYSDSPGLGLSIVQKICEVNHWTIHYRYEAPQHIISVKMPLRHGAVAL